MPKSLFGVVLRQRQRIPMQGRYSSSSQIDLSIKSHSVSYKLDPNAWQGILEIFDQRIILRDFFIGSIDIHTRINNIWSPLNPRESLLKNSFSKQGIHN